MKTAVPFTLAIVWLLASPACSSKATLGTTALVLQPPVIEKLPPGYQRVTVGPHLAGTTICTTEPLSWVREELDPSREVVTKAHEADHRALMREFPSCEAYWEWRESDPKNRITVEARGFCAAARKAYEIGRNPTLESAVWREAWDFLFYFGMTQREAADAIQAHGCSGPDPSPPQGP